VEWCLIAYSRLKFVSGKVKIIRTRLKRTRKETVLVVHRHWPVASTIYPDAIGEIDAPAPIQNLLVSRIWKIILKKPEFSGALVEKWDIWDAPRC
jgi:hypothetical protein